MVGRRLRARSSSSTLIAGLASLVWLAALAGCGGPQQEDRSGDSAHREAAGVLDDPDAFHYRGPGVIPGSDIQLADGALASVATSADGVTKVDVLPPGATAKERHDFKREIVSEEIADFFSTAGITVAHGAALSGGERSDFENQFEGQCLDMRPVFRGVEAIASARVCSASNVFPTKSLVASVSLGDGTSLISWKDAYGRDPGAMVCDARRAIPALPDVGCAGPEQQEPASSADGSPVIDLPADEAPEGAFPPASALQGEPTDCGQVDGIGTTGAGATVSVEVHGMDCERGRRLVRQFYPTVFEDGEQQEWGVNGEYTCIALENYCLGPGGWVRFS